MLSMARHARHPVRERAELLLADQGGALFVCGAIPGMRTHSTHASRSCERDARPARRGRITDREGDACRGCTGCRGSLHAPDDSSAHPERRVALGVTVVDGDDDVNAGPRAPRPALTG